MSQPEGIDFQLVGGNEAARHVDELTSLCREVYSEPPYEWNAEHEELFVEGFAKQRLLPGFGLVEARCGDELIAMIFGITLPSVTTWWQELLTPVSDYITREHTDRTFAVIELLVRKPWRRQHIAETMHNLLLQDRSEERATLTVLPAATAAQAAYAKWGWHKVAQKRNLLPGSPIFDMLVKKLRTSA